MTDTRPTQARDDQEMELHFFTLAQDLMCLASVDGFFKRLNPAFTRLLGWSAEELLARPFLDFIHPEDVESTKALVQQLAQGAATIGFENRYRHKNGSYRTILWSCTPDPATGLLYASGKDVSELRAAEIQSRAVLDAVLDGILVIDERGTVSTFSRGAERILGYPEAEVLGRNVNMLMPEPHRAQHDGYLHNYQRTGQAKIIGIGREVEGLRKDGVRVPLDLAVTEMWIEGRRLFTGTLRDIRERKEAERRIQALNESRQAILDGANVSIISTDPEGLIQTFNRAAERMLGYSAEEMIGKQTPALIHEGAEVVKRAQELTEELGVPVAPGFDAFIAKARIGGADEREWTYIRKDGTRFPVLLSITALRDSQGKVNAYLGIAADLTELRRVERLKGEFISTVSHELRTPLTSIRGALNLVLGKAAGSLPAKAQRLLEMAERNSERLTLLINDILDLEKIEGGRLDFELLPLDLTDLAARSVEDIQGLGERHGVRMELEAGPQSARVRGDAHRLLQVFANLLSNAVKFSPKGGAVRLRILRKDGCVRVEIQDHGRGIPDHFRDRIFQRFAQADGSDAREKGGSGLGLSITKAIIERHEGRIGFDSQTGTGTTFFFELPEWVELRESAPGRGDRALVCEDNPDVATVLAGILKEEGLVCDIAGTAAAASTLLGKRTYRILILDLHLPDADGLSWLRAIQENPAFEHLPVIVVSGRAEEGKARAPAGLSVMGWLQKPVDRERLVRILNEAIRGPGRPRILHVEDDPDVVQLVMNLLDDMAEYHPVPSRLEARERLERESFDLVLLDLSLADGPGLDLLNVVGETCPVVVFSAQGPSRELTRKVGEVLTKSATTNDQLVAAIRRALRLGKTAHD